MKSWFVGIFGYQIVSVGKAEAYSLTFAPETKKCHSKRDIY